MIETLTLSDLWRSRPPLTLAPDAPLSTAVSLMGERRVSSVIVVAGERPVGVFTERDVLCLVAHGDYRPAGPLREYMSPDPLTAGVGMTFAEGYARMSTRGCRHLVLVDEQERVLGILSETDFAQALGTGDLLGPNRVSDLMTRDPVTLPPDETVATALLLMAERRISSVLIAEQGRAIGILSERDAIRLAAAEGDLRAVRIAERMSAPVHVIDLDCPAGEAIQRMSTHAVRRLAVVDAQGMLVGILTRRDLLKDVQATYIRMLRRFVAVQGEALEETQRELADQALLRTVLEHSEHLGILVADSDQVIRFINDAALQTLNLTAMTAPLRSVAELFDAAGLSRALDAERLARLKCAERLTRELSLDADGEPRWLRLSASVVRDEAGNRAGYLLIIEDITNEHEQQNRLRLIGTLIENTSKGIIISDADNRILAVNPAFTLITGYSPAEVMGQDPRMLGSGRHDADFYRTLWTGLSRNGAWNGEIWNRRKDGEIYSCWMQIDRVLGPDGEVLQYVAMLTELSPADASESLEQRDPLTGLPNLTALRARLTEILEQADAGGQRVILLVLGLDGFGDLVAAHGHVAGDATLQSVAMRLSSAVATTDLLARLAGGRFVIVRLLEPGVDMAMHATALAQQLRQCVEVALDLPDLPPQQLIASVGIALYPEDGARVGSLLRHAEAALIQASEVGYGHLAFHRPELTQIARRRIKVEQELRRALRDGEFHLLYQPIIAIETATVDAVEALLRWRHPRDGMLSPCDFLEALERSDLVRPVGCWVLEQAVAQARTWESHSRVLVTINVSGSLLYSGELARDVQDALERGGLDPGRLVIEVQERSLLRDIHQAIRELKRIRDLGVAIALDDFGIGYSTLRDLKRLPIDYLKIDMALIRYLTTDPEDEAIVRSTIAAAHELGIKVIAEGVETEEQLRYLSKAGCDLAQGFLLSRLVEAEAIGQTVTSESSARRP